MTTIINNPNGGSDNTGTGVLVGVLVTLLIIILVLLFGLPYLKNRGAPMPESSTSDSTNINVTIP